MDQKNSSRDLQQWAALIEDAVSSGMTRAEWCEEHGISLWTYYYWNRKVKRLRGADEDAAFGGSEPIRKSCSVMKPETNPVFYELPASVTDPNAGIFASGSGADMILEFGQYRLTIPKDVDANALQTVLRAVRHA